MSIEIEHQAAVDQAREILRQAWHLPYVVQVRSKIERGWEPIAAFNADVIARHYAKDNAKASDDNGLGLKYRVVLASTGEEL